MKLRPTIIGLLLLGQLSCSDNNVDIHDLKDDPSISTLNGTWRVYSFENLTTNTIEYKTQENSWGKDITVTFDDTKTPNELQGLNTTNIIVGEFEYSGQRKFLVKGLSSTYAGQPQWADKFGQAIIDNNIAFKINAEQLTIYYDNATKRITLIKQ